MPDNIVGKVLWAFEEDCDGIIIMTDDNSYLFPCPHCRVLIEVNIKELNCCIFRHGVFKKNGKQINPHLPKSECDDLRAKACVYGCAMPFEIIKPEKEDGEIIVQECEYK